MGAVSSVERSSVTSPSSNRAPARRPRVVIVGAGFGGLNAARGLRHAPVNVTVIDHSNHFLFQPLLYQVATAELSPADISAPVRGILRSQRNANVMLAELTDVDVERHEVVTRNVGDGRERRIHYDYLVVATGAGGSYFGHDDWAARAPGLKTISDATSIRRDVLLAFETAEVETDPERVNALMTFVIVGGGPTGVEMAGAIADLARNGIRRDFRMIDTAQARVILVEASGRILPTFSPRLSKGAEKALRHLGVEVRTNQSVEEIDAEGVVIGGERVRAQTVIWAAGVKASPAAQWLHAEADRAGRVIVNPDMTLPGHPEIFVLGDTASAKEPDGKPLPGVASVAIQEGRYVARVIARHAAGETVPASLDRFRYFDRGYLATVGRTYAVGDIGPLKLTGFPAWIIWAGVHIAYLIGYRNRLLVLTQWLWKYVTYQRAARLITRAPQPLSSAYLPASAGDD